MSFLKMESYFTLVLLVFGGNQVSAQSYSKDTLLNGKDLDQVVVTATKSSRKLADVPMPVDIIDKDQIASSGSNRLDELLSEQTGLSIVNDHGFGVQMQGLGPEYTLILVDGEPVIGRTAGTLDLKRISLSDVERIEILKGPSSSLYGSDALAGVINIITKKGARSGIKFRSEYGTNNVFDNTLKGTFHLGEKGGLSLSANRYSTEGYDLLPRQYGQTVDPFEEYTLRGNLDYQLSPKLKVRLRGHYFTQIQHNDYLVNAVRDSIIVRGKGKEKEGRMAPVFIYKISPDWKLKLRSYWTNYQTHSHLLDDKTDTAYEKSYFNQNLWKEELQSQNILNPHQVLTTGVGISYQNLKASRYRGKRHMSNFYVYAQDEWHPTASWNILAGLRFDGPSNYASQLSPKIAAQYSRNQHWQFRASVGMGYKAPDFRQLYLDFTNNEVGYTVLGAKVIKDMTDRMLAQGQIFPGSVKIDKLNTDLKPESSMAYNMGATYKGDAGWKIDANLFRNDIKNLIDTRVIAVKSNGLPLFGYHNVHRVFTEGAEINGSVPLFDHKLNISVGYQFLIAKDKDIMDSIRTGNGSYGYKRNPNTNASERMKLSEYDGLFNRSHHTFNVKAYYRNRSWSVNARMIYRGRSGFIDRNGNLILDDGDEFTPAYALVHLDVAKRFLENKLKIETGVKDLFDYTDPHHMPYVPGRRFYVSATVHLF